MKKIAITIGDPSGIGPEVTLKALQSINEEVFVIGNNQIINKTAINLNLKIPEKAEIIDVPCDLPKIIIGQNCQESGLHAYKCLETASEMANNNEICSIVTAPTSKKAMNIAGFNFSGQTEVLETLLLPSKEAEMLFIAGDYRVMLLTRHVPLNKIFEQIDTGFVVKKVLNLHVSLQNDFNIESPKIALCGLNPHAGEEGLLGKEEKEILNPAIQILQNEYKINIEGAFPADTLFAKAGKSILQGHKQPYDAYIACYHDQGLIPVKMFAMDRAVNTTINLSKLRFSPAHGTAFDIAGKNLADFSSMQSAINLAISLTEFQRHLV
ncbi:MAG: 4-hydroxythreonine-4-phosphate dehydrogenase PdxA [Candidatus Gastranaerophilales bacterium]|nr:4-hydroxythreonine-4-phosphate dehydrogenase PdxA [Candidatus Gastranaerophilales bacterium]